MSGFRALRMVATKTTTKMLIKILKTVATFLIIYLSLCSCFYFSIDGMEMVVVFGGFLGEFVV